MAMTDHEPDIMALEPKWPDLADVLRRNQFRFIYDAPSDTMFVPFKERVAELFSLAPK